MQVLVSASLRRPVTVLMVTLAVVLLGTISAITLPVSFLPSITTPKLTITASYAGAPPAQIRELVTIPLEDSLASISGVKTISSLSRVGTTTIELEFHWGTDMNEASVETREVVDGAFPLLPSDAKKPQVLPIDPTDRPVITLSLAPRRGSLTDVRRLAEREIRTRLQQAQGVGTVVLVGGRPEEIHILVDHAQALGRGLTVQDIHGIVARTQVNAPAGSLVEGSTEYVVKSEAKASSVEELAQTLVSTAQQSFTLDQIAEVALGLGDRESMFHVDGSERIALLVHAQKGESPVSVSGAVRRRVETLRRSYGDEMDFEIVDDASVPIARSLQSLAISALIGMGIAGFVVYIFVRRPGVAGILVVSIPISIAASLAAMRAAGMTLNTISLGGLAIGIGMLVDNSVVVLDNLDRRVGRGRSRREVSAVAAATAEMAGSTLGSTLTTLIVFVPILFLPGIIGALYSDLALAVSFALMASFVVSVTIVPVLYMRGRNGKASPVRPGALWSRRILFATLRRPILVFAPLLAIVAAAPWLITRVPMELMPRINSGTLELRAVPPQGTAMERLGEISELLSLRASAQDTVASVHTRVGAERDDPYFRADPEESGEIIHGTMHLSAIAQKRSDRTIQEITALLRRDDIDVQIRRPPDLVSPLLGIDAGGIRYAVYGDTPEEVASLVEGLDSGVSIFPKARREQVTLTPRREALAQAGQTVTAVATALRAALDGTYPTQLELDGRDVDVRVRVSKEYRGSVSEVGRLRIPAGRQDSVAAAELVEISVQSEAAALARRNRRDVAYVDLAPATRAGGSPSATTSAILSGRNAESLTESVLRQNQQEILVIFSVAIAMMYLLLAAQFESFTQPLFVLLAIPLGLTGVLAALLATNSSLNLSSGLGVLVLLGIVVNNSIVLFAQYRRYVEGGASPVFAVVRGTLERLRPISMTAATTLFALLPVAVDPSNSSPQASMAIAVIGGLLFSTLLTLLVTPIVSLRFYRRRA